MARLAESSVVIAFRDWQWLNSQAEEVSPDVMVVLEGNPESQLGDLEVSFDDRLFLFEVKSTANTISEEWSKRNSNNEPKPKKLFQRMCRLLNSAGRYASAAERASNPHNLDKALENINRSLLCHHFLYWDQTPGYFAMEPYLFAIRRTHGLERPDLKSLNIGCKFIEQGKLILEENCLGLTKPSITTINDDAILFEEIKTYVPDMIKAKAVRLISGLNLNSGKDPDWQYLGLKVDDFQSYVNTVCSDLNYTTNCIVLSSSGKLFAHVVNTKDLKVLARAISVKFDDSSKPIPKGKKQKLRIANRRGDSLKNSKKPAPAKFST